LWNIGMADAQVAVMHDDTPAYGLWALVVFESLAFILFAFSFTRPKTKLDWRSLGAFSAFIVAMFAEMYGFPFTIYLLSGWLASKFPGVDIQSHDSGHLWYVLLGGHGNPHTSPIHLLANGLIALGFLLLAASWRVLLAAQREGRLATEGPYASVRHPQYDAFILIMFGFLIMWPTLPTLVMFPVLVVTYVRLAKREEAIVRSEFGAVYDEYTGRVPRFFPRLGLLRGPKHA
jgi:protein-S-isoprenylcysteine O-methyltransferase Ste14